MSWPVWLDYVKAEYKRAKLDYMLTRVPGDPRPHIAVDIFGVRFVCLLDSGASQTIVGNQGWRQLQQLGVTKVTGSDFGSVTVANGASCRSIGNVSLPIRLENKIKVINCLVVPDIDMGIILGIDFWKEMELVPSIRAGSWTFNTNCCVVQRDLLTVDQKAALNSLLTGKFNQMGTELGCAKGVFHVINTGDHPPIKQRYYPVSPYMQKIMNDELDKMIELGVVEPSSSGWSSPVVLVKKPNNEYRFCVDYRSVNKVTKRDAYAIPYISMILDRLRNCKYLSSVDLKSAYWQMPLEESSKEKTAFTVPGRGLFQFRRMPFGLHNAPATWQRFVDNTLGHDLEPFVFIYLDDIIVATPDFETHLRVLEKIFDRLIAAGLTVNQEKCEFVKSQLKYLGYVVDSNGLRVDPDKVAAIMEFPTPTKVKEVRRLLGLASWYRRFVPKFSERVAPLTNLTKKNKKFIWDEETERSFLDIKQCLVSAPILTCPDFDKPFILQTDASQRALGAVLVQEFEDGEKVIAYASRTLNHCESKYCATELECLAVIWAVKKFRCYLEGVRFQVVTDHASLRWLSNLKEPSGRLGRWVLQLQAYDFDIIHRKGKYHQVPDALSRAVPDTCLIEVQPEDHDEWYRKQCKNVSSNPNKYPLWKVENGKLYKFVTSKVPHLDDVFEWKVVVPKGLRKSVLQENHDDVTAGHLGIFKTKGRISQTYYWPGMSADVVKYVRGCEVCQAQKPEQRAPAGLMGSRKVSKPWQVVCTDLMGPFPMSSKKNRFLLVVADVFTKYTLMFPLTSATAPRIKRHVEEDVFLVYGVPEMVLCDNGKQYVGKEFTDMLAKYNVELCLNPMYHPQSNPTERINRVLKTMIRSYVNENHRTWDVNLAKLGFALRTSVHEVTGHTPAYLNFGRELPLSGKPQLGKHIDGGNVAFGDRQPLGEHVQELQRTHKVVGQRLKDAYKSSAKRYNLRRRPVTFEVGDIVMKRNHVLSDAANYFSAKLAPKFVKCRVRSKVSTNVYRLENFDDKKIVGDYHVCDLKPYVDRPESAAGSGSED